MRTKNLKNSTRTQNMVPNYKKNTWHSPPKEDELPNTGAAPNGLAACCPNTGCCCCCCGLPKAGGLWDAKEPNVGALAEAKLQKYQRITSYKMLCTISIM